MSLQASAKHQSVSSYWKFSSSTMEHQHHLYAINLSTIRPIKKLYQNAPNWTNFSKFFPGEHAPGPPLVWDVLHFATHVLWLAPPLIFWDLWPDHPKFPSFGPVTFNKCYCLSIVPAVLSEELWLFRKAHETQEAMHVLFNENCWLCDHVLHIADTAIIANKMADKKWFFLVFSQTKT